MTMTTYQLTLAISVIVVLLVTPLIAMLIVRLMIPLDEAEELIEPEPEIEFESLRDFWEGTIPHLRELRDRLFKAGLAILAGTGLAAIVVYDKTLLGASLPELIINHLLPSGVKLQGITVAESFVSYMHIALIVGIAIAMPIVVYQIIAFFAPALRPIEKRVVFTALPFVSELFLAGLAFGWFFTVPAAVDYLTTFGTSARIENSPSVSNFLSTVATLLLWNGIVFELPAIIYLLARIGLVSATTLANGRRYAIAVIVIAAAIITPTGDPFNLMLLAVPMYVLYELGVLLARFVPKPAESQPSLSEAK